MSPDTGWSVREADAWGERVAEQIASAFRGHTLSVTVLAGAAYERPLRVLRRDGWGTGAIASAYHAPLAGLGIGRRLQWLSEARRAVAAVSP